MNEHDENNSNREDEESSEVPKNCKGLVDQVLVSGMDYINNTRLKDVKVLLCYYFGSENLRGIPNIGAFGGCY